MGVGQRGYRFYVCELKIDAFCNARLSFQTGTFEWRTDARLKRKAGATGPSLLRLQQLHQAYGRVR